MSGESRAPLPFVPPTTPLKPVQRNEARMFALGLVRDPIYRAKLLSDWRARKLAPAIEAMVFAYAFGRPTEHVEVGGPGAFQELETMTIEQLRERALKLVENLTKPPEVAAKEAEAEARVQTDAVLQAKEFKRLRQEGNQDPADKTSRSPVKAIMAAMRENGDIS